MNNLNVESFLPLGSVVSLKKSPDKELMIIGFCVGKETEDKKEYYDYMACLWPIGVVDTNKNYVFNHEEIGEVVFKGLENENESAFKKQLAEIVKGLLANKGSKS